VRLLRDYLHYFHVTLIRLVFTPYKKFLKGFSQILEWIGVSNKAISSFITLLSMNRLWFDALIYVGVDRSFAAHCRLSKNDQLQSFCYAKPQYYYESHEMKHFQENRLSPVLLNDVGVIGSSNILITQHNKLIYEAHILNREDNYIYDDPAYFFHNCDKFMIRYKEYRETIATGISFCGNYSWNYYHYLTEILAKFVLLQGADIDRAVPILIDDSVEKIPQFKELLDCFNKDGRKIVFMKPGYRYNVKNLCFLPAVNFIPPNFKDIQKAKPEDCFFSVESLQYLRNALLPKSKASDYGKKIYLSRKANKSRRRCNETEVSALFEKYGFSIVQPETLSVAEQIGLFNGAQFIAGSTGAAFTNMIFCEPGCKALCFQSCVLELSFFSTIAKFAGVDFQYFTAHDRDYKTNDLHEKFTLDIVELERVLVEFLEK